MQPPGHSLIPLHAQLGTLPSRHLFPQEPCDPLPHFLELWSQISPPQSPPYLKSRPPCCQTRCSSFLLYFSPHHLAPTAIDLSVYFLPLPIRMPSSWEQSCCFVLCSISSSQTHTGMAQSRCSQKSCWLDEWIHKYSLPTQLSVLGMLALWFLHPADYSYFETPSFLQAAILEPSPLLASRPLWISLPSPVVTWWHTHVASTSADSLKNYAYFYLYHLISPCPL